jgi:hypothetical protein
MTPIVQVAPGATETPALHGPVVFADTKSPVIATAENSTAVVALVLVTVTV